MKKRNDTQSLPQEVSGAVVIICDGWEMRSSGLPSLMAKTSHKKLQSRKLAKPFTKKKPKKNMSVEDWKELDATIFFDEVKVSFEMK